MLFLVIDQSIQLHVDSMDLPEVLTISSRPLVLIQYCAQTVLMHHQCKIALTTNRKLRDPFLSQRPKRIIAPFLSTQLLTVFRLLTLELQYLTSAASLVLPFSIIFLLPLQFRPQYFVKSSYIILSYPDRPIYFQSGLLNTGAQSSNFIPRKLYQQRPSPATALS